MMKHFYRWSRIENMTCAIRNPENFRRRFCEHPKNDTMPTHSRRPYRLVCTCYRLSLILSLSLSELARGPRYIHMCTYILCRRKRFRVLFLNAAHRSIITRTRWFPTDWVLVYELIPFPIHAVVISVSRSIYNIMSTRILRDKR